MRWPERFFIASFTGCFIVLASSLITIGLGVISLHYPALRFSERVQDTLHNIFVVQWLVGSVLGLIGLIGQMLGDILSGGRR